MGTTGSRTSVLAYCLTVMALLMTGIWLAVGTGSSEVSAAANTGGGTTFPGTGTGTIADGGPGCGPLGVARDVTFNVSGITGPPTDVSVDMTMTHSWVGDVRVVLIAPDATEHVIFSDTQSTSATGCGDSSDLGNTYAFNDAAAGNWWAEALNGAGTYVMMGGNYRTSSAGDVAGGGALTVMNDAFAGVANPNGTWTLRVQDGAGGDTGSISAANLTLTGGAAPTGATHVDFDGDGITDYSQGRHNAPPLNGETGILAFGSYRERINAMQERGIGKEVPTSETTGPPAPGGTADWYIANSGGSPSVTSFGTASTDFFVPQDFDGDGKSDIAVWRGVGPSGPGGGYFFIMNSGTMTVDTVDFGVQNDDPTVSGDYDGDGKADPAVYRCPASPGQCFYYYKGSAGGGETTFVPWGFGTSFTLFPAVGDFDGDGKYDFNIQSTDPASAGQGLFTLLRSSDFGIEYIRWGLDTDLIIPGDYDGDGMTDIAIGRSAGGLREWWILERDGGIVATQWGLSSDFLTPGDYDGDGKTDIAIWRPSTGDFFVYNSGSNTATGFNWGVAGDYPFANFQVH